MNYDQYNNNQITPKGVIVNNPNKEKIEKEIIKFKVERDKESFSLFGRKKSFEFCDVKETKKKKSIFDIFKSNKTPDPEETYEYKPLSQLNIPTESALFQQPAPQPSQNTNSMPQSDFGYQYQAQQPAFANVSDTMICSTPGIDYDRCEETTLLSNVDYDEETTLLVDDSFNMHQRRRAFLIRKKTGERIEISKSVFKLGKNRNTVDYCIDNNKVISRNHADIVYKDDHYYVTDNNSLNHTYVNGEQIQSQALILLQENTVIRMADEEFEFQLI